MDPHRLAELRSIAYHERIAEKLLDDPSLIDRARARLERAEREGTTHPEYIAAWRSLLARPVADVCAALTRDDDEHRALRQCTPFAGALDPRERWRIHREVRERAEAR